MRIEEIDEKEIDGHGDGDYATLIYKVKLSAEKPLLCIHTYACFHFHFHLLREMHIHIHIHFTWSMTVFDSISSSPIPLPLSWAWAFRESYQTCSARVYFHLLKYIFLTIFFRKN